MNMITNNNKAATKGSKYFELGRQLNEFSNSKYLFMNTLLPAKEAMISESGHFQHGSVIASQMTNMNFI